MNSQFPRTVVGGLSLSRMIIGTNWLAGWSHRTPSADAMIKERHAAPESIEPMLDVFLSHGVDTMMAPFGQTPAILEAVRRAEQKHGRGMILIDTPMINVDDNPNARREAEAAIRRSREMGAQFCLLHHSSAEQLVNKNKHEITRLDDYTKMIRDAGLIPGLSAHMPELVVYSDEQGYDVETYIQIYNCMGFLMQVEIETVNQIIRAAKKPVMTIKPMAAGRCTPFVGLNFSWATIRDCDMVTVGCFNEREAAEDVEISLAALERRAPNVGVRSSPNQNQAAFGAK
ncbi:MAG TPA: hypothetical protein IAB55_06080 [Candidatus Merdivicinus faecavium]|nr:hypothetical protein [Candidatus Merdivicinus faecavium]